MDCRAAGYRIYSNDGAGPKTIIACARCARDGSKAPPILELAWHSERYHSLPESGGLLDQPAGVLNKMAIASNVYAAFVAFKHSTHLAEWADTHPQEFKTVVEIERLEKSYG